MRAASCAGPSAEPEGRSVSAQDREGTTGVPRPRLTPRLAKELPQGNRAKALCNLRYYRAAANACYVDYEIISK